ncbi:MAG: hypothetical protein R3309_02690, partial [Reinekea sp.]|nr:hypothetical protein [Reinekea sp.]
YVKQLRFWRHQRNAGVCPLYRLSWIALDAASYCSPFLCPVFFSQTTAVHDLSDVAPDRIQRLSLLPYDPHNQVPTP